MGRIFRYTFAGALGAIIAWGVMEPTALMPDVEKSIPYGYTLAIGLIAGLLIGLLLGLAEAASGLTLKDAKKAILLGALVGAGGGMLGLAFGSAVYGVMWQMAGPAASTQLPAGVPAQATQGLRNGRGFLDFLLLLFGRGFGWALIGAFIGVSQGIATGSPKKMLNGAIGGFLGGGLGGSFMEVMKWINGIPGVSIPPFMIRFFSFTITGAAVGFFMGCAEEIAKQAWLVRLVGNNEGRNIDLYASRMVIGRDEFADIPVFGDPDIAERHAAISVVGKAYAIEDLGSVFGTFINGSKITGRDYLRDGDLITVGKSKFAFHDKATARAYTPAYSEAGVQIPTSQHVCPFCGAVKDASGNCECTVGAPQSNGQPQPLTRQPAGQPTMSQPTPVQASDPFGGPGPGIPLNGGQSGGARLVGMAGPYAGQAFALKGGETHIGREASKDIGLPMDTTVSRNHARIAHEVTSYVIYDSGSTNGVYVGGAKVQRKELKPGDVVQIGNTKFQFEQ